MVQTGAQVVAAASFSHITDVGVNGHLLLYGSGNAAGTKSVKSLGSVFVNKTGGTSRKKKRGIQSNA